MNSDSRVISYMLGVMRTYKWYIFLMLFTSTCLAADPMIIYFMKSLVDYAAQGHEILFTSWPILALIITESVVFIQYRLHGYFLHTKFDALLRKVSGEYAIGNLLTKNHMFYTKNMTGELGNKVSNFSEVIGKLMEVMFEELFPKIVMLFVSVYIVAETSILFGIIMLVWTFSFIIFSVLCAKKVQKMSEDLYGNISTMVGKVVDVLGNILSVRIFNRHDYEKRSMQLEFEKIRQSDFRLRYFYFLVFSYYGVSYMIIQGLCVYLLVNGYKTGAFTVSDFVSIIPVNAMAASKFWEFAVDAYELSQNFGKMKQALNSIDDPDVLSKSCDGLSNLSKESYILSKIDGSIEFDNVSFEYSEQEGISNDLSECKDEGSAIVCQSIKIQPQEKIGIVGHSGAGKSTFVNLLLGLYKPTSGRILIDQHDISDLGYEELAKIIGYVPQDPSLFQRSIRENIIYSKPDATYDEMVQAAKQAMAHDFIMKLPDQYDTILGERGSRISGGEKQRIYIARAILGDFKVMILDESTSQLDSITESMINTQLMKVMKDKTMIVIAHRLSSVAKMDRIFVFDKGKIVDFGSHNDLVAKDGVYKSLWNMQSGMKNF